MSSTKRNVNDSQPSLIAYICLASLLVFWPMLVIYLLIRQI